MSTYDKPTGDNAQSPRPAAQQKPGSGITDKVGYETHQHFPRCVLTSANYSSCSGVVNVIHGRLAYRQVMLLHYDSNVSS